MCEELSDNSKTIAQSLENARSRSIYAGKLTPDKAIYGPSMEEDEEIDSSFRRFDGPLTMDFKSMRKVKDVKLPTRIRKVAARFPSQIKIRLPLLKLQKKLWN